MKYARFGLAVVAAFAALRHATAVDLVALDDSAFESARAGTPSRWMCAAPFRLSSSDGHNGSGGLVWESAEACPHQAGARQEVKLAPGTAYYYSALVRTENLETSSRNGATLCVEWYGADGKWMAGAYVPGVAARNQDWTLVKGVTREIPASAARVVVMLYLPKGARGKACFDNVRLEPVNRPPVAYVFSSAYRNVAVSGPVRFHASLYRPAAATNSAVYFTYTDAAGAERRVPATQAWAEGATFACAVEDLAPGNSRVACELVSSAGTVLGSAACSFRRVAEMPRRRVWIDAHKRCIVDGKPFFPVGLYCGRLEGEQLEMYARGPFNAVMPYKRVTRADLDALAAKGIMAYASLRNEMLGTPWAARQKITTQDQVDAYYAREIAKIKDHPALLAWYVNDECPATEVPVRTHLRNVFESCDPDHPTWAVLDRTYDLREFIPTFDVLGMDPYPVTLKPLKHVTEMMREVNRIICNDIALWNVPQAFDWGWYRKHEKAVQRFPTEEEIAHMNWQHIAAGANGLIAYCFHALFRAECTPEARETYWGRICRAFKPVQDAIPVLLSVEPAPTVTGVPATMATRVWAKDGAVYILAVNLENTRQEAALHLSSGHWRVAGTCAGQAARAEANGGTCHLALPPLGYAFIRLAPGGAPESVH